MLVIYDEIRHDLWKNKPSRTPIPILVPGTLSSTQLSSCIQRNDHDRIDPASGNIKTTNGHQYICHECTDPASCPVRKFVERTNLICDF